jgi:hypothetical protein
MNWQGRKVESFESSNKNFQPLKDKTTNFSLETAGSNYSVTRRHMP